MRWLMPWLGIAGFLFVTRLMICGDALASTSGNLFTKISTLIGFNAGTGTCAGLPEWANFVMGLFIVIPGLVLIGTLLVPIVAGASANPIVGTIIALAVITGIVALVAAIF